MTDREFLRHTLATLAYRAAKTMREVPDSFASFQAGPTSRTPLEIVAHMGDLFAWAISMAKGTPVWHTTTPTTWPQERDRFFAELTAFDRCLSGEEAAHYELTRLFQGPVADALTHTGQLAMLRRMANCPMKGESYNRADVQIGRTRLIQTPPDPRYEFE